VPGRISIPGREIQEIKGEQIKLHYEELHNVHFSPDMTGVIRSWKVKYAVNVALMGRREIHN
jgi:hypothetical protein